MSPTFKPARSPIQVAMSALQAQGALPRSANRFQNFGVQTNFAPTDWGSTSLITRFAGQPGAGLTAYRQWANQQYYDQLRRFVTINQITKNLTVAAIDQFQAKIEKLIDTTFNPPWLISQLLSWGHELASALQGMVEEARRLGISVVAVINLTTAEAVKWLRSHSRKLLKLLGVSRPVVPHTTVDVVVHPTYGRLTCVQTCAPPLA